MSHAIDWQLQDFDAFSARELYAMLRLRSQVFVVEQKCVFLDLDNWDPYCQHLVAWQGETPVACLRLVPPDLHPKACPSIGRVVTAESVRGFGMGRELMRRGVALIDELWPGQDCVIGAQSYLRRFYESFGFVVDGEEYDEDGILHWPMRRTGMIACKEQAPA